MCSCSLCCSCCFSVDFCFCCLASLQCLAARLLFSSNKGTTIILWSIFSIFNQNSRSPLVSTVHANCFRTVNLLFVEDITQAMSHRVLKWARFGGGSTSGLMLIGWHAANMSSVSSGKERNVDEWSVLCLPAHIMYKGIRQLRLSVLTWVAPFRQQSHFSSCRQALSGSTDYVELFSMNVNLKMFCILSLCIILCDTSKASENLSFVLKHLTLILLSVFVVIVCFLEVGAIKIQDCRTNDIRFFISKLWCAWGSKCNFDSNYATENLSVRRHSWEPSRVGCLWRNFHVWIWSDELKNTFKRISQSLPKFIIIPIELMYFVMLS